MENITNIKSKLHINTDQNKVSNYEKYKVNKPFQIQKTRWLIENMIQYKKREDMKTKILGILLFFVFNLPYIGLDIYFWEDTNNIELYLYITISINQRILSIFILSYYMLDSDIDSIYKQIKNKNGLYYLCNIDMNWCQYYSSIGILLATKFYILYGYIDSIYLYILIISILKLCSMIYFIKQT